LKHIREEEDVILPAFEKTVDLDKLVDLGTLFLEKKVTAPTRPHPEAPTTYPFNVAVNYVTEHVDKLRDSYRFAAERTVEEETRR
jgi:hypothetical protein